MKTPGFFSAALLALGLSLISSVLLAALLQIMSFQAAARGVLTTVSLLYVWFLLAGSGERVGRIIVSLIWLFGAGTLWVLDPTLKLFAFGHLAMIWMVRCLYYQTGMIGALIDLGLIGLGVASALWAWPQTQSVFMTTWCFFLSQALFVQIPKLGSRPSAAEVNNVDFDTAYRCADAALRRLSNKAHRRPS